MSQLRADDPRLLGAYRLSARLGQGGQGVVYLGHTGQGAKVAIKLLHASLSADPEVRRRFLAEIEAVRRVAPFCTAQLLDADLDGDRPYLVSEYVDGVSLREHVAGQGPRAGGSLHRLAIGTATALGAIHRAGVVHRDFKPGNVLLSLDGPRVIDFGVSRLVDGPATGRLPIGTPAYLAPERIKGETAGPPADLYAWALTVAFTATGRHAFAGGTPQEVMARILYGKPDLGVLSGRLRRIVDACLAPEPGDRPDAEEVLRRLLGQDVAGDVLTSGAMAAINLRIPAGDGPDAPTVGAPGAGSSPGAPTDGAGSRTPSRGYGGFSPVEATGGGAPATVAWRVPPRARSEVTGSRALARLVETSEPAPVGTPEPVSISTAEPVPISTPGPPPSPRGRRLTRWPLAAAVLLAALVVTAFVLWPDGGGAGSRWTGSVAHAGAEAAVPVDIRLGERADSSMRWGSGLRCSGMLRPTGKDRTYELRDVAGTACHPGTLRMRPIGDSDQMVITVTPQGQPEVTYSGKVARSS